MEQLILWIVSSLEAVSILIEIKYFFKLNLGIIHPFT